MKRRAIALAETVVATSLAVGLCAVFVPDDPLLIQTGFGWIWILPALLALRDGTLLGAASGVILLAAWYLLHSGVDPAMPLSLVHGFMDSPNARRFPIHFFFGGFVLTLLCGQFGDIWGTRLRQGQVAHDYLAERLAILTRNQFMLRLSHERLEQDLMSRPATLRDSLVQLRQFTLAQDSHAGETGDVPLRGAQSFLNAAAQACQFERASIHAWRGKGALAEAAAQVGEPFPFVPDDPLIREALDSHTLTHVASVTQQAAAQSAYVVCVPLVDALKQPIGLLVVHSMPFLALNSDNLQFLVVLCHFYSDGVRHAAVTRDILQAFPSCPYEFALDYARLARLARDTGITSALVALVFEHSERRETLFQHVLRSRRALDAQWVRRDERRLTVLTLMPLAAEGAVDGYLLRIEDNLRGQFGVDFEAAHVAVHAIAVPRDEPIGALRRLLRLCDGQS